MKIISTSQNMTQKEPPTKQRNDFTNLDFAKFFLDFIKSFLCLTGIYPERRCLFLEFAFSYHSYIPNKLQFYDSLPWNE